MTALRFYLKTKNILKIFSLFFLPPVTLPAISSCRKILAISKPSNY